MPQVSTLLSPIKLGSVLLRNRLVMSALTRDRSVPTNVPNKLNLEYYEQRAKGGAGLILCEGTLISQQGTEWRNAPGIWSDEQVDAWKKITDAVHAQDGKIFCQLWHVGRVAHPEAPEQIKSGLHSAILLNANVTPTEADQLIQEGKIAAAVFGWLWIANPDAAIRLQEGIPLNENVDVRTLYGGNMPKNEEAMSKGYTDYPFASRNDMTKNRKSAL
ncbi:hypothetical protein M0805_002864 [Coniferiporia weirii]|nr:hypothetical protein M0805_002864 [Coniferiporia weirii]